MRNLLKTLLSPMTHLRNLSEQPDVQESKPQDQKLEEYGESG